MSSSSASRDSLLFSYRYLTAVNLITMGTELCASAAFGYLPPLLLEAGFSESGMSTVMAAGPFLALFLLPVMGTASDQCRSRYGRRRPFILMLSLGIILSLILIPNTHVIMESIGPVLANGRFSMMLLASLVVLLDFCSQVCYTPIESLLSDPCRTELQRNRSFSIFSVMTSLGACIGYWVVSINWSETKIGEFFGGQQKTLFGILLVSFCMTLVISLLIAHDPPLNNVSEESHEMKLASTTHIHNYNLNSGLPLIKPISDRTMQSVLIPVPTKPVAKNTSFKCTNKKVTSPLQLNISCGLLPKPTLSPIFDTIEGIRTMPQAMQILWLSHLVTCMAVMGFRLYFTDYVGESIFHGNPESPAESLSRVAYQNGVRMGSFGLFLHSVLSAIFSLLISTVISSWGSVTTYLFGMATFTVATLLMLFADNIAFLLLLASLTGFANATITTVPYTVLTGYHQKRELYFQDNSSTSDKPLHGKGADLALLDSAYILSEVISSFAFGVIVDVSKWTGAYITCSCVCGLASCLLVLKIK